MTTPYLIHEFATALVERVANALLRVAGGPVQLPRSNDDFGFY